MDRGRPWPARRLGPARAGGLFLHEAEGIAEYKTAAIFQGQGWNSLKLHMFFLCEGAKH